MRRPLAVAVLVLGLLAATAYGIYAKPAGTYRLSFFGEPGGTLKVKQLKLTKLKLKPTEELAAECEIPGTIGLSAKPKLKQFNDAGGRYAFGKLDKNGLIVPKGVTFKIGGATVGGQLELLFDESGKTLTTGRAVIGGCSIQFSGNR